MTNPQQATEPTTIELSPYSWKSVFTKSRGFSGDYSISTSWRERVMAVIAESGFDFENDTSASMTGYGGDCLTGSLLDGGIKWVSGVGRAEPGFSNGMWLDGRNALRYVLYRLNIAQPRRFKNEERIPTFDELDAIAKADREAFESTHPRPATRVVYLMHEYRAGHRVTVQIGSDRYAELLAEGEGPYIITKTRYDQFPKNITHFIRAVSTD